MLKFVYICLFLAWSGLVIRFLSISRKGRFFQQDQSTWAKRIFHLNFFWAFLNTLFQIRLFRAGKIRWIIHGIMVLGFTYLFFVHALDDLTSGLFAWYQPGIAPFRYLRNLAGVMVALGGLLFLIRRLDGSRINYERRAGGSRFRRVGRWIPVVWVRGTVSILIILCLAGTGFLLETSRIISPQRFDEMVQDYSGLGGEPELADLKAVWARDYYVAFDDFSSGGDLGNGAELNETYCLDCHDVPDPAFISAPVAKWIARGQARPWLDGLHLSWAEGNWPVSLRSDTLLYWAHLASAMVLLVCLPFSRMFHLVAVPLASMVRQVRPEELRYDMGYLDVFSLRACTQCGFCSQVCSVYPDYLSSGNRQVLPHVKVDTIGKLAAKGLWDARTVAALRSGNDDCTLCGRCADICPSNIDLVRLWLSAGRLMDSLGCPDNYTQVMAASFDQYSSRALPYSGSGSGPAGPFSVSSTDETFNGGAVTDQDKPATFENCVQCTLCTNVCPVAAHDLNILDFFPHQVMNLLRLGESGLAEGSKMVWHCLTCYACQEICPQGIRVADILLELRCRSQKKAEQLKLSQLKGVK